MTSTTTRPRSWRPTGRCSGDSSRAATPGITWPKEYGGQGLPDAYEWAFLDEAADFVLPDFGALTITTFYVCVPTMLAYAPPEFLRRFVPKSPGRGRAGLPVLLRTLLGLGPGRGPDPGDQGR